MKDKDRKQRLSCLSCSFSFINKQTNKLWERETGNPWGSDLVPECIRIELNQFNLNEQYDKAPSADRPSSLSKGQQGQQGKEIDRARPLDQHKAQQGKARRGEARRGGNHQVCLSSSLVERGGSQPRCGTSGVLSSAALSHWSSSSCWGSPWTTNQLSL